MITYIGPRMVVALFVKDILQTFGPACLSITITPVARSADCSVTIVTDASLVDTVRNWAQRYCKGVTITSIKNTRGG